MTYGFNQNNDVKIRNEKIAYENNLPIGMDFNIEAGGQSSLFSLRGVIGRTHLYPIAAAASVALEERITLQSVAQTKFAPPPGRMRLISGKNGSLLVDDSYNASPIAVEEALETLRQIETSGKKIVMLGDMLELGKHSTEEHRRLGKLAATIVDEIWAVGNRAKTFAEGAREAGMATEKIKTFDHSQNAGEAMLEKLRVGDIILIKGSQSIRMERATKILMAKPEMAEKLLVRQDKDWKRR